VRHRRFGFLAAVAAVACTAVVVTLAPASAGGTPSAVPGIVLPAAVPLSATVSNAGHVVTYAIGGASVPSGALADRFDGVVTAGANVTLSGSTSFGPIGAGVATYVSMQASLGSQQKTFAEDVSGPWPAHTMDFSLSMTAPTGTPGADGVVTWFYVVIQSQNCGGICDSASASLTLGVIGSATPAPTSTPTPTPSHSTAPTPTPTPTPSGDKSPPVVRVRASSGVIGTGERIKMDFSVEDNSGKAKWYVGLLSDGAWVGKGHSAGLVRARGKWITGGTWPYPKTAPGPFYVCVRAVDAAGNWSVGSPYSACQWLSVQIPITRASNGCGGSDWGDAALAAMNWFADTRVYGDVEIPMKPACDKHDAAYAGTTVAGIRTKKPIDYRGWSREQVDIQFGQDLQHQCARWLRGPALTAERQTCLAEVATYLALVRQWGVTVYDADVTTPGIQQTAPATTIPSGGGRLNN
jgi:hypothetical protein